MQSVNTEKNGFSLQNLLFVFGFSLRVSAS